jgi:hypothetical protein
LHAHIDDVRADDNYKVADVLFLSETWALESDSDSLYHINDFFLYRADCPGPTSHRHQGIVFLRHKRRIGFDVDEKIRLTGMQLLKVFVSLPDDSRLTIIGIYRAPNFPLEQLLDRLIDVVPQLDIPCIIIGDFNVNLLKPSNSDAKLLLDFFSFRQFH